MSEPVSVSHQPRRRAVVVLLLPALLSVVGCAAVRDFLIPPPEGRSRAVLRRVHTQAAHLVLDNVRLASGQVRSVAIRGERILAVADRATVHKRVNAGTVVIDGAGQTLTPGLADGHVHLEGWALLGESVDLRQVTSVVALVSKLKQGGGVVPAGGWMWAYGLRPELVSKVTAATLEAALPGQSIWLSTADGHQAVLSRALLARIPGGARIRDGSGHLSERAARQAWYALPPPGGERLKAFVVQKLQNLAAKGITTVHVMGARPALRTTLEELDAAGRLSVRCRLYLAWPAPSTQAWLRRRVAARAAARARARKGSRPLVARQAAAPTTAGSRLVDVVGVKVWLDGTLGGRTASLSQPYADRPQAPVPAPYLSVAALRQLLAQTDAGDVQLAVHAIGDAAVERVVQALREAHRPATAWPVRIEHAQVVRPDQLKALSQIGPVICSTQPLHRLADAAWASARLGPARSAWAYRAASLARVCPLLAGSDVPVGAVAPWRAMQALTAPARGVERLTFAAALAAHTRDVRTGRARKVAVGERADLVLWRTLPAPGSAKRPQVRALILAGVFIPSR